MTDPLEWFRQWYAEESARTSSKVPGACCLSTIGTEGYPNARFLALKDVTPKGFIITGPLSSRKGIELSAHPRAALTFWWPHTERQVRIQGDAEPISAGEADNYFHERSRESQLLVLASRQGEELDGDEQLAQRYRDAEVAHRDQPVSRPEWWGGYCIRPVRIEFLEFSESRLHRRLLYQRRGDRWIVTPLQP